MGARLETRERIVRAAAALLAAGGREAASTRAVADAAGVQVPTIYRLFGDMRGLLDAVAEFGFAEYLREKTARLLADDPVEELRRGWDLHVEFGLANPALYRLMYEATPPGTPLPSAAVEGVAFLRAKIARVAEAGRLRVGVERAVRMFHAAGAGVALTLIAAPPGERDPGLSAATREAILAAILAPPAREARPEGEAGRAARHAVALRAVLADVDGALSAAERALLAEWLDAIAAGAG